MTSVYPQYTSRQMHLLPMFGSPGWLLPPLNWSVPPLAQSGWPPGQSKVLARTARLVSAPAGLNILHKSGAP